ncbi:hypothetical protein WR25_08544 [Diploscapter pachys]|uniref:Uncharacterized protein n=1 Tax=Diploscapter pachys TaxID=2018661 RepID=A0A2A2KEC8_9BILA|nr:hypothetical protein WR25_08544 [Diploscapter pachys]
MMRMASSRSLPQMSASALKPPHTCGRSGLPNSAQSWNGLLSDSGLVGNIDGSRGLRTTGPPPRSGSRCLTISLGRLRSIFGLCSGLATALLTGLAFTLGLVFGLALGLTAGLAAAFAADLCTPCALAAGSAACTAPAGSQGNAQHRAMTRGRNRFIGTGNVSCKTRMLPVPHSSDKPTKVNL